MQNPLEQDEGRLSPGRVRALLLTILLAAGAVRGLTAYVVAQTIDSDTASFLYQAQTLVKGDAHGWFAIHHKPPLYSGLIAAGWQLGLGPIQAARIISLFAGLMILHPAWLLLRRSGPTPAAVTGLAILAMMPEPVATSARCLSDATYAAILTYGLYFLVLPGLTDGRVWAFAAAGLLSGLAFLTRTEGLMLTGIGLLLLLVGLIARKVPWRKALAGGLLLTATCAVPVVPYVAMVSQAEGRLTIRRNMGQFMAYSAGATAEAIPSEGKGPSEVEALTDNAGSLALNWAKNLGKYTYSYVPRCGGYVTGLFLLAGLAALGRRLFRWSPCQIGLWAFVLSLCVLSLIGPNTRHLLGTISLTGMLMGVGVMWLHRQADKLRLPGRTSLWAPTAIPLIAIIAVTGVTVAKTLRYDAHREVGLRQAAAIIAQQAGDSDRGPVVATSEPAVAWFAGGELAAFSEKWSLSANQLREFLRDNKVEYLVLEKAELAAAGLDDRSALYPPEFLHLVGQALGDPRSRTRSHLFVYRVVTDSR